MFWPTAATIIMHALMIMALTANWESSEDNIITPTVIPPQIVNATLVSIDEFRPKPKPKPVPPKAKPKPKVDPKIEQRKQAEAKKVKQAAIAKQKAKDKAVQDAATQAELEKQRAREAAAREADRQRAELAARQQAEQAWRRSQEEADRAMAASSAEMSASYAGLIQRTVVNNWSRPPSARNGMEALLSIQLIPTGDIVSVTVLKSSGNGAFDRSAINAVEKAGSFPELKNLPIREFERTFRRFRLLFRPEDLRY
ncbi:MAG: cell envelope integrity protein TolA [Halioglobus sp.]